MKVLKSVGPMSVGKNLGTMYAIAGFVFGLIFSLVSLVGLGGSMHRGPGIFFGIGAVVILPVFYGLGGFVGGIIAAWIYNVISKWVGGIEMELEDKM